MTHDLNSTEALVDIVGRQGSAGGEHKTLFGAAAPTQGWSQTYGTPSSDAVRSLVQTSDGGYALAGDAYPVQSVDFWLFKTDSAGNVLWSKTYGGADYEKAQCMVQTSDEGYALAGYTASFGAGGCDFWLVKTDKDGSMSWNRTYGGLGNEYVYSLVQTVDGGYALAGTVYSDARLEDIWLIKTDTNGNMLWNKKYGGLGTDSASCLVQTSDGGYALAGYTTSYGAGGPDFWLVRTDSAGNSLWNRTYGGLDSDVSWSLVQTSDGGYALGGYTRSYGAGSEDFWLVRTDSGGQALWNKTYGGKNGDKAYSVVQAGDGGFALGGYTVPYGASKEDFWLIRTDSAGDTLWDRTYGGVNAEYAYSLVQASDGGYALAGETRSHGSGAVDAWLVKTDLGGVAEVDFGCA